MCGGGTSKGKMGGGGGGDGFKDVVKRHFYTTILQISAIAYNAIPVLFKQFFTAN